MISSPPTDVEHFFALLNLEDVKGKKVTIHQTVTRGCNSHCVHLTLPVFICYSQPRVLQAS